MAVERRRQQVAERRATVTRLWARHLTQEEIAAAVGVDQSTISRDIKALVVAWRAEALTEVADLRAREFADLDSMEREAAMAASVGRSAVELARLLEVRLRVKERRARMLGLDAPKRQEFAGLIGTLSARDLNLTKLSADELAELQRLVEKLDVAHP